jgi:phage protein D
MDVIDHPMSSLRKEVEILKLRLQSIEKLTEQNVKVLLELADRHNSMVADTQKIALLLTRNQENLLATMQSLGDEMMAMETRIAILELKVD